MDAIQVFICCRLWSLDSTISSKRRSKSWENWSCEMSKPSSCYQNKSSSSSSSSSTTTTTSRTSRTSSNHPIPTSKLVGFVLFQNVSYRTTHQPFCSLQEFGLAMTVVELGWDGKNKSCRLWQIILGQKHSIIGS